MRKEITGLTFWFLFSLFVAVESYRLGLGEWGAPDAGYVPFGASVALGLISLCLLVKKWFEKAPGEAGRFIPRERLNWQDLGLTVIGMCVYILFFKWVGFVLCTFGLMLFLVWVVGKMRPFASLIAAVSITLVSYLLFEILLDAQFPKGILEGVLPGF